MGEVRIGARARHGSTQRTEARRGEVGLAQTECAGHAHAVHFKTGSEQSDCVSDGPIEH
jgi:hypothetical protein